MKHLLLACLFPMTLTAQTMQQLTEQLGKTVLYSDVALSPDGAHAAWVQSAAAATSKQTYISGTSANARAVMAKIPGPVDRIDFVSGYGRVARGVGPSGVHAVDAVVPAHRAVVGALQLQPATATYGTTS